MKQRKSRPGPWRSALALVLPLASSACGGSGNSPDPPPPVAQPQALPADDAIIARTGTDQLVDVLGNDRSSDGSALTLVSVEGAGAATLVIEGNRVRYRPACCDATTAEFAYVVRAGAGPTARATVRVVVERAIVVHVAAPELGAAAVIEGRIGTARVDAEAAAAGTARFALPFRTDAALVAFDARRAARERLVSVAGDVPSLALRAGIDGELTHAEWDALRVSSLSTALAGLLRERHGANELPESTATWTAWLASPYAVDEWLLRAQVVAHALGDAALPLGASDTCALASSELAVREVLAGLPTNFAAQDRSALFPGAALAAMPSAAVPPALGEFWLWRDGFDLGDAAAHVIVAGDGSATVVSPHGELSYRVAANAGALELVADVATGTALDFERLERAGPICRVGNPIATHVPALRAATLRLHQIAIAIRGVAPLALAVGFDGVVLTGFSPSSCATFLSAVSRQADRGMRYAAVPSGASLPPPAAALGGRTWLLPYCDEACRAGTPSDAAMSSRLASFSESTPTLGAFEGGGPVAVSDRDGAWRLTVPSNWETIVHAVDVRGGVFRTVVEQLPRSMRRSVSETYVAALDPALGVEALIGRTIEDCCRRYALGGLHFTSATEAVLDGVRYAAQVEGDGRTIAIATPNPGPAPPQRLRLTVVARAGDRVLLLLRADDALEGTAEAVRLREP